MPSTIVSNNNNNKTFKWASPQRVKSGRVHKRTGSNVSSSSRSSTSSLGSKKSSSSSSHHSSSNAISRLESEITFTFDTFATVTVMYDSLQHAYASSKEEMEKTRNATRLSEKEKELLAAYDDLGLQVVHLERQVVKLEKRLAELRSMTPVSVAPATPIVAPMSQPQQQQEPVLEQAPIVPTQQVKQSFDYMTTPDLTMPSPTTSPIRSGYTSTDYFSHDMEQSNFYPSPPVSNQPAPSIQDPTLFCEYAMVPPQQQQYIPLDQFVADPYYAACWSMQQQPIQF
ncbi:hypothetical protein BDA99DRAFT_502802 [Phascolomyces articulosus]|uniref:Uncharacterized protein n=1 Tax=Phascolomyces articulosus TaxID=60185 RepID=A0AAD5PFP5_9FUNG|nr:hypothetical protein BDA99DRAFT_502802 [Phascolomyces articulosus]